MRDAIKSSAPLAALFKWMKCTELRAEQQQLMRPAETGVVQNVKDVANPPPTISELDVTDDAETISEVVTQL